MPKIIFWPWNMYSENRKHKPTYCIVVYGTWYRKTSNVKDYTVVNGCNFYSFEAF